MTKRHIFLRKLNDRFGHTVESYVQRAGGTHVENTVERLLIAKFGEKHVLRSENGTALDKKMKVDIALGIGRIGVLIQVKLNSGTKLTWPRKLWNVEQYEVDRVIRILLKTNKDAKALTNIGNIIETIINEENITQDHIVVIDATDEKAIIEVTTDEELLKLKEEEKKGE